MVVYIFKDCKISIWRRYFKLTGIYLGLNCFKEGGREVIYWMYQRMHVVNLL